MILFIDHHAEGFRTVQHEPAADVFGGMLAADEMALDEDLLVQLSQIIHRLGKGVGHFRQGADGGQHGIQHLYALGLFGPGGEGGTAQIARQPHAAGHDDAIIGTVLASGLRRRDKK